MIYIQEECLPDWRCPTCGMGVADDYICCPYCRKKLKFEKATIKEEQSTVQLNHKSNEGFENLVENLKGKA